MPLSYNIIVIAVTSLPTDNSGANEYAVCPSLKNNGKCDDKILQISNLIPEKIKLTEWMQESVRWTKNKKGRNGLV